MKQFKYIGFSLLVLFFLFLGCKKNKYKVVTLKGYVHNKLTNEPLVGYEVYFLTRKTPSQRKLNRGESVKGDGQNTITDNTGYFQFDNVEVYESSNNYDYFHLLQVWDGYIQCDGFYCLEGATGSVGYNDISETYDLKVIPRYAALKIGLNNNVPVVYPDSVNVKIRHESSLVPSSNFSSTSYRNNMFSSTFIVANGKWYLDVYKVKNSVITSYTDSLTLNIMQNHTYTLNY